MPQHDADIREYDRMQKADEDRQGGRYEEHQQRGLIEQQEGQAGRRGESWKGYVVPYRYYGPGYRGVGYYSVAYLGPDDDAGQTQQDTAQRGGRSGPGQGAGGFAGRGPKGYRRSDERICEDICDRLMADEWLDASDVEVNVANGEVTLTGSVDERASKRLAEDLAEDVAGVREVMNQLRVRGAQEGTSSERGPDATQGMASQRSPASEPTQTNGKRERTASSR